MSLLEGLAGFACLGPAAEDKNRRPMPPICQQLDVCFPGESFEEDEEKIRGGSEKEIGFRV